MTPLCRVFTRAFSGPCHVPIKSILRPLRDSSLVTVVPEYIATMNFFFPVYLKTCQVSRSTLGARRGRTRIPSSPLS